jgi:hypothetical protein
VFLVLLLLLLLLLLIVLAAFLDLVGVNFIIKIQQIMEIVIVWHLPIWVDVVLQGCVDCLIRLVVLFLGHI